MIKIDNIFNPKKAGIFVKLEEFNPGGSVKSRPGFQMVLDAQKQSLLTKDKIILEPTGGNTGLGITIAAITLGYKVKLVVPDNFSAEKIKTLRKYGADIILSDHTSGPGSHIRLADKILKESREEYVFLDQFSNPSNPKSHYLTTGPEIKKQLNGRHIDVFISGIGTGGTLMGVGKYLKEINSETKIVGVQPKGCDLIKGKFIPHKIEATSVGIIPSILDFEMLSHIVDIDFDELRDLKNWLIRKHAIFVGISSVGNILAALKEACNYEKGKIIVTIAPDSGRSYLDHKW